jgi:CelD/BcsL family acetyltransferase involved in cellulose biosynthesis
MLYLESARKEGTAVASLRQLAPAQWQQSEEMLCPFTPLPASWEDFEQQLGKNLRYNLKRYNRHLAQLGDVCYTQVAHADELPQAIASLQRLHKITRQGEAAEELFWNGRMVSFQEEVATRFLAKNWLRFYRLQLNGADIGLVYAFYYHNKLFYYMTGYDQELSRYGPGRQIMGHTIRTLIAEGGREIDFLRGDERYKFEWLAQPRYTLHLKIAASRRAELLMKAKQIKSGIRARL